jgi:hypothetical protein
VDFSRFSCKWGYGLLTATNRLSVKGNKKFTYSKLSSNLEQEPHPQPPHRLRGGGWDVPYMTGNRCK